MRLGVAGESEQDVLLITGLADRLLTQTVPWIEPEEIDAYRQWVGTANEAWLYVGRAFERARAERLPIYGYFRGEPGALDAQMHRAVLHLFANKGPRPAAVVIARDVDGKAERIIGFEQARSDRDWPFAIVGALAQPEVEAWLISAWIPRTPDEQDVLDQARRDLGFDPTSASHLLTSKRATDKKDAKRILDLLSDQDRSAAEECWRTADIERLRQNGRENGLTRFLTETEEQIVSAFRNDSELQ